MQTNLDSYKPDVQLATLLRVTWDGVSKTGELRVQEFYDIAIGQGYRFNQIDSEMAYWRNMGAVETSTRAWRSGMKGKDCPDTRPFIKVNLDKLDKLLGL